MTATIIEKKDRLNYYILIRYKDEKLCKERQKWISTDIPIKGNNKRKIEFERERVLAKFREENTDLSRSDLFTDFIKEWLEDLKPSIELVTYDTYRLIIYNQIIPFFEPQKLKVKELTTKHIQKYINFKLQKVSPNTVRKHLWNISKCLDSAVNQDIIAYNPVKRIDLPKKIKYTDAKHYNEAHIERLLNVSKNDILEPIILLTIFYGLRRSETLGLKWNAIDFENNTLEIKHTVVRVDKELHKKNSTKNDSSYRIMPLSPIIKQSLETLKENQIQYKMLQPNDYIDEGYLFTLPNGRLISPNYVTKHFKQLLERNGLPVIRFHDLRHSAANYLLRLGFSMKEVQVWLGHGDIGTTMNIYAKFDIEDKENISKSLEEKFKNFNI